MPDPALPVLPPAPHLTEPTLEPVGPDGLDDWIRAVGRGFQEAVTDDQLAIDRAVLEVDRSFGFRAGATPPPNLVPRVFSRR